MCDTMGTSALMSTPSSPSGSPAAIPRGENPSPALGEPDAPSATLESTPANPLVVSDVEEFGEVAAAFFRPDAVADPVIDPPRPLFTVAGWPVTVSGTVIAACSVVLAGVCGFLFHVLMRAH